VKAVLRHSGSLFQPSKAEEIAASLNADDDWTYTAVHCPKGTGLSFVQIADEDGAIVGKV